MMNDLNVLFEKLSKSKFRNGFHLKDKDKQYVLDKGIDTIRAHAKDFVASRLAPALIPNDGKQTPTKGHPVFIGQHATACCCRGCLRKWHYIPEKRALTGEEQAYVVNVLMSWIEREMQGYNPTEQNAEINKELRENEQMTITFD